MSERPFDTDLPPTNEPLRVAVRRMRWFRAAFGTYVEALGRHIGCTYRIDDAKIATIFVRWLRAVEAQRPRDLRDRQAFFEFAAGLMLRELTADMPLVAKATPTKVEAKSAAAFWPEGYAATLFCLSVHTAVMDQEFRERTEVTPDIADLRIWWSFRENAREDPGFSTGFLQMVLGHQPNWTMPDVFRARLRADAENGTLREPQGDADAPAPYARQP
jgi:hypothetical protein